MKVSSPGVLRQGRRVGLARGAGGAAPCVIQLELKSGVQVDQALTIFSLWSFYWPVSQWNTVMRVTIIYVINGEITEFNSVHIYMYPNDSFNTFIENI